MQSKNILEKIDSKINFIIHQNLTSLSFCFHLIYYDIKVQVNQTEVIFIHLEV